VAEEDEPARRATLQRKPREVGEKSKHVLREFREAMEPRKRARVE